MSRILPTGLDTALSADKVYPVVMVALDWPGTPLYVWNGYHTINWSGVDWVGVGHLGGISEIKESSGSQANGVAVTLSGVPSANVALALSDSSQGRRARIFFGVISAAGFTIDPYCVFDGVIDYASLVSSGETATITVNLEKELFDDRSDARRWTHEDQQIDYPGDLGFRQVAEIANKSFTWGKATVSPTLTTPGDSISIGDYAKPIF